MTESTPPPDEAPYERGPAAAAATFRLPFYARLWTSNLVQTVCFQVLSLAMQWLVTTLTPLRSALGLVGFVQGASIAVASPAAGVVVDRLPKRALIVWGRVGLAAVAAAIAWLVGSGAIAYWHLLVAAVVGGVLAALLMPATQTFVVDVVGLRRTEHAVALNAMGTSFGLMGGGALAGVLVAAVGMVATYSIATAGIVAAALLVGTIRVRGGGEGRSRVDVLGDLREGFAYVRERPPLLLALLGCSMALFNGAMNPMRPVFARHVLGVGPEGFGALSAAHGVGTFVMAIAITLRPPRRNMGLLIVGSMLAFAVGLLLYSFAFSYAWAVGVELWLGCAGQLWNVAVVTGFQLAVPEEMRGRVLSMVFTLAQLGFIGALVVGALADSLGDQLALGIFGALPTAFLIGLLAVGWKTLKQM